MDDLIKEYKKMFGDEPPFYYYLLEPNEWYSLIKKCIKNNKPAWFYLDTQDPNKTNNII